MSVSNGDRPQRDWTHGDTVLMCLLGFVLLSFLTAAGYDVGAKDRRRRDVHLANLMGHHDVANAIQEQP